MRPGHQDVIADSIRLENITIPANTGNGSTLETLKGEQTYDEKIVGWRIVENDGAFQYSRNADAGAPAPTVDAELGWAPPLGRQAMKDFYLRSSSANTVAAVLEIYIAQDDVNND